MTTPRANPILHYLRRLAARMEEDSSDGELLRRYVSHHDEEAFARLMNRHRPMVQGVSLRVLGNWHDSEDVVQATFLVLARKAATLRSQESAAGWLYRVAHHLALKVRDADRRRQARERRSAGRASSDPLDDIRLSEARALLDAELVALPEKYRGPIILCCLETATRDEAARQLGWSLATLKRRLAKGRELLRMRLARRGLTLSAVFAGSLLAPDQGIAASSAPSARAATLAEGVLRAMTMTKLKMTAALVLAVGVLMAGSGMLLRQVGSAPEPAPVTQGEDQPKADVRLQVGKDRYGDDLPPGALARLGTVRLRHGVPVLCVAFSADGKWIASSGGVFRPGRDYTASLWDAATGKELRRFRGHQDRISAVAVCPDGKTVATGSDDRTVRLWDAVTAKELHRLEGHQDKINAIAFSPNGKVLASASHDRTIRLWDAATGKELRQLVGHQHVVMSVAFTPKGETLVSGGADGTLRLWEAATGKELRQIGEKQERLTGIALSLDGRKLASGGVDRIVRLWDLETGKLLRALHGHEQEVQSVAFSPDGRTLASSGRDGTIRLWDVGTGKERTRLLGHQDRVRSVAFSPDGKTLASASWDHSLRLWDVATGKERLPLRGHHAYVGIVAFSADGRTLASSGRDSTIRFWDAATGAELRHFVGGQERGKAVVFARDGKSLALGDPQGRIHLLDAASGREIRRFGQHAQAILGVAFSPDGKQLASSGVDGTVRLWETATGKPLHVFQGHEGEVLVVAFSPDGKLIASGSGDRTVRLWDVSTGEELHCLKGHGGGIETVAFSADGRLLASGNREAILRLWDVASGKRLHEFVTPVPGYFNSVTFSADGKMLAANNPSASGILVWELATRKERCRFSGHRGAIVSVAMAPDGRRLASGGADGTALIWDLTGRLKGGRLATVKLSPRQLAAAWDDLGDADAARAYRAIWTLAADPEQASALLRQHLRPAGAAEEERLRQWIKDLDHDQFSVREKAVRELEKRGPAAEPALRKLVKDPLSLESRRRAEQILEKISTAIPSAEQVRTLRGLEVLEHLATAEARKILEELSRGAPDAWLTHQAKASLARLARQSPP